MHCARCRCHHRRQHLQPTRMLFIEGDRMEERSKETGGEKERQREDREKMGWRRHDCAPDWVTAEVELWSTEDGWTDGWEEEKMKEKRSGKTPGLIKMSQENSASLCGRCVCTWLNEERYYTHFLTPLAWLNQHFLLWSHQTVGRASFYRCVHNGLHRMHLDAELGWEWPKCDLFDYVEQNMNTANERHVVCYAWRE